MTKIEDYRRSVEGPGTLDRGSGILFGTGFMELLASVGIQRMETVSTTLRMYTLRTYEYLWYVQRRGSLRYRFGVAHRDRPVV
jgi:hypothetical protein